MIKLFVKLMVALVLLAAVALVSVFLYTRLNTQDGRNRYFQKFVVAPRVEYVSEVI